VPGQPIEFGSLVSLPCDRDDEPVVVALPTSTMTISAEPVDTPLRWGGCGRMSAILWLFGVDGLAVTPKWRSPRGDHDWRPVRKRSPVMAHRRARLRHGSRGSRPAQRRTRSRARSPACSSSHPVDARRHVPIFTARDEHDGHDEPITLSTPPVRLVRIAARRRRPYEINRRDGAPPRRGRRRRDRCWSPPRSHDQRRSRPTGPDRIDSPVG